MLLPRYFIFLQTISCFYFHQIMVKILRLSVKIPFVLFFFSENRPCCENFKCGKQIAYTKSFFVKLHGRFISHANISGNKFFFFFIIISIVYKVFFIVFSIFFFILFVKCFKDVFAHQEIW